MAYLHKKTFDILQRGGLDNDRHDYFEVDDMMALPVRVLNQKGYTTTFCCAGHPFEDITGIDETTNEPEKHTDFSSYISFAEGVVLPSIPLGFFIIREYPAIEKCLTIRTFYDRELDAYSFMQKVLVKMAFLYEWTLGLTDRME